MPVQTIKVYPGSNYDFSFGGEATVAWDDSGPTFDIVDDPAGAPDGMAGRFAAAFAAARTGYAEYKSAGALSGVSIAAVRMYARVKAKNTGSGTFTLPVTGFVRPAGSGTGSTGAHFLSPVPFESTPGDVDVWHDLYLGQWTADPVTSLAFTLATINSMSWGARFEAPATDPAVNGSVHLDQIYLEIDLANIAADIDGVRFVLSSFARMFGRPVRMVDITGPLKLADVELFETFTLEHALGPIPESAEAFGQGWGREPWLRRQLLPISKTYNPNGTVTLKCFNPRDFYTNWWSPLYTDVGHSLDGQGIALLHSGGGGISVDRNQVAYVERPGRPPDGRIMTVDAELPAYHASGLAVEGAGSTNSLLNSTFSQGTGDSFDNWTPTVTGTGTVGEPADGFFQFDVDGLRRACAISVGASAGSVAYNTSDWVSVTGPFRVRARGYNNFGAGKFGLKIQRTSDNWFYNVEDEEWQAGPIDPSRFSNDAGFFEWVSPLIDPESSDDVRVHVGYFGEGSDAGYNGLATCVEILTGSTIVGSDLPTTDAPVTRVESYDVIRNDELARVWNPIRGSITLGVRPWFNLEDLADCEEKTFLFANHGEGVFEEILFRKGGAECGEDDVWVFRRDGEEATFVASGATIPTRGVWVKLAVRWVATDGELGLPAYTHQIFVNNAKGNDQVVADVPAINPTATILVGSNGDDSWSDARIRELDFSPLVLFDEELARRAS